MSNVFFIVLRRMRAPLIVLIVIYAVSILGLVLIPGVDAQSNPANMSFFHAFYFISYTATTIGFGELPYTFTDAQRLWVMFSIYLSVVGWSYSILTLLALLQDRGFRQVLITWRFCRKIQRLTEPFYLVCGYGETGSLLCKALDRLGICFVVVDADENRLNELGLEDFTTDTPYLAADVRSPQTLLLAGLQYPDCKGVIAVTNDDSANLAVAIAVRLLNPSVPVLCRAETQETVANMASFGTDHIINPYETYGEYLALAVRAPGCYRLHEWLTAVPGSSLRDETEPPRGPWIVCGYGRFGKSVVKNLDKEGVQITVIDPSPALVCEQQHFIGLGTDAETLRQAGADQAAGIVAGTESSVNNLSIAMTAREINPRLFVLLRQNTLANRALFEAFHADLTIVPSEIIAHECLAVLTTPLLARFLRIVKQQQDSWADMIIQQLQKTIGSTAPTIWGVSLTATEAPALHRNLIAGDTGLVLEILLRDASNREEYLPCVPLLLIHETQEIIRPGVDLRLASLDQILFAGTPKARALQSLTLQNVNVSDYVRFGKDVPGGWIWQWLNRPLT